MTTPLGPNTSRIKLNKESADYTNPYIAMTHGSNDIGVYDYPGTPESNVTANKGSVCLDTSNGKVYVKTTGTTALPLATGWQLVGSDGGYQSYFSAKKTDSQDITFSTNRTTIPAANFIKGFATAMVDKNGDFNITEGTFTAPITGPYVFSASVGLTSVSTNNTSAVFFEVS